MPARPDTSPRDLPAETDSGLVLQATPDMRSYVPDRVAAVFQQLRTVLPPGTPSEFVSDVAPRLVHEEACPLAP